MVFQEMPRRHVPAFNVPAVILALAAIMIAVHLVRTYFLSDVQDFWVILTFAFIPARYGLDPTIARLPPGFEFPGGFAADLWTYVTYGFLHGDWTHVIVNLLWMFAFGSVVARRFGTIRFLILSTVATVAGVLLHQVFHFGELIPVVGASAAVSGHMGAATRFAFSGGQSILGAAGPGGLAHSLPAVGLWSALKDRRVIAFVAVWFGINILFGTGLVSMPGAEAGIAWEAHIGGFLVGLLGFSFFDPPVQYPDYSASSE